MFTEMFEEDESDTIERVKLELGQDDIVIQTARDAEVQKLFENNIKANKLIRH